MSEKLIKRSYDVCHQHKTHNWTYDDHKLLVEALNEANARIAVYREALELCRDNAEQITYFNNDTVTKKIEQALSQPPSELLERIKHLEEDNKILRDTLNGMSQ